MSKKLKKNKREKTEKELRRKTPTFLLELPLGVDEGPLKYRFFAGPASQAEGGNAISICSNGFPGGFTGNLSKKPILESGAGGDDKSRAEVEQVRPFPRVLGTGDFGGRLVYQGVGPIPKQTPCADSRGVELLSHHRLDGIAPQRHDLPSHLRVV